jgi:lysophospholipid acyltransferase (LPLAT)-like uncharacterized protein
MKIKIQPGSIPYKILLFIGVIFIKLWLKTLRVRLVDPNGVNRPDSNPHFIFVMWHNRVPGVLPLFHKNIRRKTIGMTSRSKDGQIMTDVLSSFDLRTIRGSAAKDGKSKGGAAALIHSIRALKEGNSICITPDGPRGPKYEVQLGAILASSKSGIPVLPLSINYKSCWQMKSWDALQIPKLFSKVDLIIGDPIQFDADLKKDDFENATKTLKDALMKLTVDPGSTNV